jgi:acyl carrier protein
MGDIGFLLLLALGASASSGLNGATNARRRRLRQERVWGREPLSDELFAAGISALSPVPPSFARAFRMHVARAIGVDPARLRPEDHLRKDLRAVSLEAWELAGVLERAFDVRVRVMDLARAATLRELCKLVYARQLEPSEATPPLHRDPVPKERAPEA